MTHATTPQKKVSSEHASPLRIVLHGSLGRMGTRLTACIEADPTCTLVEAIDRHQPFVAAIGTADLLVDFSSDEGVLRATQAATNLQCALLVGTTGLSAASLEAIHRTALRVPVMIAANTSLGVAVTRKLVADAARLLQGFDTDIVETHHIRKLDSPSGTAKSLAQAVAVGSGKPMNPSRIHAIRAGDVVGEHTVTFSGPGERIAISHAATSRDLFALGALRMGRWLALQAPGLHHTDDWFAHFARS